MAMMDSQACWVFCRALSVSRVSRAFSLQVSTASYEEAVLLRSVFLVRICRIGPYTYHLDWNSTCGSADGLSTLDALDTCTNVLPITDEIPPRNRHASLVPARVRLLTVLRPSIVPLPRPSQRHSYGMARPGNFLGLSSPSPVQVVAGFGNLSGIGQPRYHRRRSSRTPLWFV